MCELGVEMKTQTFFLLKEQIDEASDPVPQ